MKGTNTKNLKRVPVQWIISPIWLCVHKSWMWLMDSGEVSVIHQTHLVRWMIYPDSVKQSEANRWARTEWNWLAIVWNYVTWNFPMWIWNVTERRIQFWISSPRKGRLHPLRKKEIHARRPRQAKEEGGSISQQDRIALLGACPRMDAPHLGMPRTSSSYSRHIPPGQDIEGISQQHHLLTALSQGDGVMEVTYTSPVTGPDPWMLPLYGTNLNVTECCSFWDLRCWNHLCCNVSICSMSSFKPNRRDICKNSTSDISGNSNCMQLTICPWFPLISTGIRCVSLFEFNPSRSILSQLFNRHGLLCLLLILFWLYF